jgi:hypothetical protein
MDQRERERERERDLGVLKYSRGWERKVGSHLEVAGDLVGDGTEELLAVRLGVGAADSAALRGVAVAQDGDDERLVRAPSCGAARPRQNGRHTVRSRGRSPVRRHVDKEMLV